MLPSIIVADLWPVSASISKRRPMLWADSVARKYQSILLIAILLVTASSGAFAESPELTLSNTVLRPISTEPPSTFIPHLAPVFVNKPATLKGPKTLSELLALSPSELEQVDIARRNLLCAEGLKGSESLELEKSLAVLDELARQIQDYTKTQLPTFRTNRFACGNKTGSEGYFRALVLVTYLHRTFGIRYNPDLEIPPVERHFELVRKMGEDSRHMFLHGLLFGQKLGTCSTIPLLVVAIGQRLGYPIRLVETRCHLFARWDSSDGKERFNIEATRGGLLTPSDDHYKTWPYPVREEDIRNAPFLKSMTAAEEMALFIVNRAGYLVQHGYARDAVFYIPLVQRLAPHARKYDRLLKWSDTPPTNSVSGEIEFTPVDFNPPDLIPLVWQPSAEDSIEEVIQRAEAERRFWDQIHKEAEAISQANREATERRIEEINEAARSRSERMAPRIPGMPSSPKPGDPFGLKRPLVYFDPSQNSYVPVQPHVPIPSNARLDAAPNGWPSNPGTTFETPVIADHPSSGPFAIQRTPTSIMATNNGLPRPPRPTPPSRP